MVFLLVVDVPVVEVETVEDGILVKDNFLWKSTFGVGLGTGKEVNPTFGGMKRCCKVGAKTVSSPSIHSPPSTQLHASCDFCFKVFSGRQLDKYGLRYLLE